jgi:hypothetical protein
MEMMGLKDTQLFKTLQNGFTPKQRAKKMEKLEFVTEILPKFPNYFGEQG